MLLFQSLRFFLCFPASVADDVAVNSNGIKTLTLITFFINGKPISSNEQKVYQEIFLIVAS